MREILFRGKGNKKYNGGGWYYGVPIQCDDDDWQICTSCSMRTVVTETIGQYTGLVDKNGTKIFEEDIVHFDYMGVNKGVNGTATVIFQNGQFGVFWGWHKEFVPLTGFCNTTIEVIGNIHDNPELLGSDTE